MFSYDVERFRVVIAELTRKHIAEEAWDWLNAHLGKREDLNLTFSLISRKVNRREIELNDYELADLSGLRNNVSFQNWNSDRLARVCLLTFLTPESELDYMRAIEALWQAADVEEQVALYSALSFLAFPEMWKKRCAEGIRSNIGKVLEAIMYENPYPAEQLDEAAWNQLVLKAFFTEKDVSRIYGLEARSNQELAFILSDYAHERWSASRAVPLLLWPIVAKFPNDQILKDLEKVISTGTDAEKQLVLKALRNSDDPDAENLLTKFTNERTTK